jgi:hypothetical protein
VDGRQRWDRQFFKVSNQPQVLAKRSRASFALLPLKTLTVGSKRSCPGAHQQCSEGSPLDFGFRRAEVFYQLSTEQIEWRIGEREYAERA